MDPISPEMVLDKPAIDSGGAPLGRVVDVGLFDHARVKFLVVEDPSNLVTVRRYAVDDIVDLSADTVRLRVAQA